MHEINEGTLGREQEHVLPHFFNQIFSEFFRHSVLPACQICLQNTNFCCPPRQPIFRLKWMMQPYIIQFERLPAAGTDRCPPDSPLSVGPKAYSAHTFNLLDPELFF
jgi:hypothetical protein